MPIEGGARVESRAARRDRRRRRRRAVANTIRAIAAVLAIATLGAAGIAHTLYTTLSNNAGNLPGVDAGPGNSDAAGVDGADMNILIVGNDSRAGYTPEQLAQLNAGAEDTGTNTDTIMLIHVPANGKSATVVSFPRDSWVNIPGVGDGKINSAYADGYAATDGTDAQKRAAGQTLLIDTISQLTGVQVDGYVEVTLLGVVELTDQLGGIEVNMCDAVKDSYSGTDLPAGKTTLTGPQALSFVRQRHGLDEYGGDLARVRRQQYFFGAVIRKVLSTNLLNISKVDDLVQALSGTIHYSAGLDPITIADQMRDVAAGQVQFTTIPVVNLDGKVGDADVVFVEPPAQIKQFIIELNNTPGGTTSSAAPSSSPAPQGSPTPDTSSPNVPDSASESSSSASFDPAAPSVTTAADQDCIH